jgi:hypothetical protein
MEWEGITIMGQRLTERNGAGVAYVGKHSKVPGLDTAGTMRVAAVRECMQRLAEYEDTGLSPEQITKNLPLLSGTK